LSSESDEERGTVPFQKGKNFEKKNEKKLAKFFEKMLRRIEETKLYLG